MLKKLRPVHIIIIPFLFAAVIINITFYECHHFSIVASELLEGKLYMPIWADMTDSVLFNGKYYFTLAPLPTFILLPFVWIYRFFSTSPMSEGYLQIFSILVTFFLGYKIAKRAKYSENDSLYLTFAFSFASIHINAALLSCSWDLSHALSTALIFLSLYEFLNKKRYWVIGILHGFILMTRFAGVFGIVFYLLDVTFSKDILLKAKFAKYIKLCIPILLAGLSLMVYNYARFSDFLDFGYLGVAQANYFFRTPGLGEYGMFSLRYLPYNIYNYFLKLTNSYPGASFFCDFPNLFIWIKNRYKKLFS